MYTVYPIFAAYTRHLVGFLPSTTKLNSPSRKNVELCFKNSRAFQHCTRWPGRETRLFMKLLLFLYSEDFR